MSDINKAVLRGRAVINDGEDIVSRTETTEQAIQYNAHVCRQALTPSRDCHECQRITATEGVLGAGSSRTKSVSVWMPHFVWGGNK